MPVTIIQTVAPREEVLEKIQNALDAFIPYQTAGDDWEASTGAGRIPIDEFSYEEGRGLREHEPDEDRKAALLDAYLTVRNHPDVYPAEETAPSGLQPQLPFDTDGLVF
jgi:hypothetical protein